MGNADGNHLAIPAFAGDSRYWAGLMQNAEKQLAAIGFGRSRSEPACWRAERLDRPLLPVPGSQAGAEPACSQALMRWRDLLARNPHPSPYRISRVNG